MKYLFLLLTITFLMSCQKEELPEHCVIVKSSTGYVTDIQPVSGDYLRVVIDDEYYFVVFTMKDYSCQMMTEREGMEINSEYNESLKGEHNQQYWYNYANKVEVILDPECDC